jgi:hypothetical protein
MADAPGVGTTTKGAAGAKPNAQARRNTTAKPNYRQAKFKGQCEELKGNIYDCKGGFQVDQYAKTTKEISNYVGRTYRQGADVKMAINQIDTGLPTIAQPPPDPAVNATQAETKIWEKNLISMLSALIKGKQTSRRSTRSCGASVQMQCRQKLKQMRHIMPWLH